MKRYYVRVVMHYMGQYKATERDYSGNRLEYDEAEAELKDAENNPFVVSAWIEEDTDWNREMEECFRRACARDDDEHNYSGLLEDDA